MPWLAQMAQGIQEESETCTTGVGEQRPQERVLQTPPSKPEGLDPDRERLGQDPIGQLVVQIQAKERDEPTGRIGKKEPNEGMRNRARAKSDQQSALP